ncbi:type 1 glutamine amidotransferase domain-containing protein [Pseudarthrobacter oxydans]|uniref:type 1 glutamine amidotransferase domain-containing protein n=1 Tax=Pseudarthrobacter oxydans TaxID=1671 RepID=UPI00344FE5E3
MTLSGQRVALLIEDEYQVLEAWYPKLRLEEAGAQVSVIGSGTKKRYDSKEHYPMDVDAAAGEVIAADFDAVVVPGGFAPDNMRLHPEMIDLVRDIHHDGKLVAAICHGGWMLVSAGVLKGGRRATGYLPIRHDVENAGGVWVDEPVVEDGNVITSRTPADLPAFGAALVSYLERNNS